jgi:hypothetical protein
MLILFLKISYLIALNFFVIFNRICYLFTAKKVRYHTLHHHAKYVIEIYVQIKEALCAVITPLWNNLFC